ncbi:response regulator receiver protein [Solidesulfovibrio carbinoliphilus subsp. oakridgensis]|uniref:Response regulator receiver protein n=1 Tax=Solidesulfovibrio carbinoliphilus subsp. oakridgensis TaxID=694327 RepID=G7QAV6_9BACT|nr:response regulator [Solidesulfovibrio carbinoliphilus]EHJ48297.1 response regulator receiver protein [Solidesulfovibrio carbinoliphilus subsp. oakridgensis]
MTAGPAILVVDDQLPMRKTIAYILRQLGLKDIHLAEDGEAAWKILNATSVDLVLLDWNMPRLSGLSLLERIRKSEDYARLPVVMVTAEANEEHILAAVGAGVTNYVVKPFTPETLARKIREALEARPPRLAPGLRRPAG